MAANTGGRVKNAASVLSTVCVGTQFEKRLSQGAFKSCAPKAEHISILTNDETGHKSDESIRKELREAVEGKKGVFVISDVGDTRPYTFEKLAADLKAANPSAAFALLTSRQECIGEQAAMERFVAERGYAPGEIMPKVDYVFHYSGNDEVFSLMLRLHEDRLNYARDSERNILVIEDLPSYYTSYLLALEGINNRRTRLLLARDFESAQKLVRETEGRLSGSIIDMKFPKGGRMSETACWEIADLIRSSDPKSPIIFQSAESSLIFEAERRGGVFTLHKSDEALTYKLRNIMLDFFGFGPFIFREPESGKVIGKVDGLRGLVEFVKAACEGSVMAESLLYHARLNNFSNWLWLQGHKEAAAQLKTKDSKTLEEVKANVLGACEKYL